MGEKEGLRGLLVKFCWGSQPRCMFTAVSGGLSGLGWFKYRFWELTEIVFAVLNSGATIS